VPPARRARGRGELLDALAQLFRVELVRAQRQRSAVLAGEGEPLGVDVDRDDLGPERRRDLHAEPAYAAGADEHREVAVLHVRAQDRLIRSRDRVGDHREHPQLEAVRVARPRGEVGHLAEAVRGDAHVRGETAVHVVAGEHLLAADRAAPRPAGAADAARDHGRDDDAEAAPVLGPLAGRDDRAADLVAERQRQGVARRHALVAEAQVGVADAATGDLDEDLIRARLLVARLFDHRLSDGSHRPSGHVHGWLRGTSSRWRLVRTEASAANF
jgi:hypothetical protein